MLFFFSSRRRHTRYWRDWSSDVSSSDLLFTPFASTKPTGTGLGLSITQRVIEEHGGRITGANRPEGGACFTVLLPAPACQIGRASCRERVQSSVVDV